MSPRQATLLTLLVIVGTVAVGLPAVTAQETATETVATGNNSTGGMGTQLTAFLQSNSAAANDTVENGMWKAAYNQSNETERADLVMKRAGALEQRLERLKARNASLEQRYENGSISAQAYVAQQSRLRAQIAGLQTAINDTDAAAEAAGVNDTSLERLKQNASELSGQQVAAIARGVAGRPADAGPNGSERGRPDDAGRNRSEQGPPEDAGANESDQGPPDDAGTNPANETEDPGNARGNNSRGNGSNGESAGNTSTAGNGTDTDGEDTAGNSGGEAGNGQSDGGNASEADDADGAEDDAGKNSGSDSGQGDGDGAGNGNAQSPLWTRPLA